MAFKDAKLEAVAVKEEQFPAEDKLEIAFAGRSNVGKSSLLNLLTGKKGLARVSQYPGKTRTINFYDISQDFRIVDLPGYGYAKVSKKMRDGWGDMIENYLENRKALKQVVQLVDIRHEPTEQDLGMREYLKHFNLAGLVVATKADKVSRNEMTKRLREIRKAFKLCEEDKLIAVSSFKRTGMEELLEELNAIYRL